MPNGNIRQYHITYYRTASADPSQDMLQNMTDGKTTTTELTGLMIFTTYNISIQAMTVELGDPSETVTVTTDEDCECF